MTNIGTAYIGRLGSVENIAKAKCEALNIFTNEGTLIAYDDKLIKNLTLKYPFNLL
ncbi:MAG: Mur ligase family protein [Anaerotruncus sp.]|nr:Mur ligase family protein [Anaerotruncus sp.]